MPAKKEDGLDVTQVANYLLDNFDGNRFDITNLKINKIIYFLHGYFLARHRCYLIRNHFETWEYGPVVGTLYHSLKIYGNKPISDKISHLNYETGNMEYVSYQKLLNVFGDSIKTIASDLVAKSTWRLVDETHAAGEAWHVVRQSQSHPKRSTRIPDELIAEHYRNLIGGNILH